MWYEQLPPGASWAALRSGYVLCGQCRGIRRAKESCPACGNPPYSLEPTTVVLNGREVTVAATFMGAEGRYEDWIYLQMLEREWKRPLTESERASGTAPAGEPSQRAAVVVLFWSYFETRVERLLRAAMRAVPPRLTDDTLQRYSSIGARLDRLYRVLFQTTYWADLADLGFADIGRHLARVQERRNAFAHGDPKATDDALARAVVENLRREHESWIAAFNRHGAHP